MTTAPLILASASTARRNLLLRAGVAVAIEPAHLDEAAIKASFRREGAPAADCAMALAEAKALAVARRYAGALVIGADQLLVCDGAWFDKPRDLAEAGAQLLALRGKTHELVTALAVVREDAVIWRAIERPRLTMRAFTPRFLDDYVAEVGDEVLGSVGAYQLEGRGAQLFARIEGDYFAILGLPLLPLLHFLRGQGVVAT